MDDPVSVELDDYAQAAWRDLIDARTARNAADENYAKARQTLETFLSTHGASIGTINGRKAVTRTATSRSDFDVEAFRTDQPFLYDRYLRSADVVTVRGYA